MSVDGKMAEPCVRCRRSGMSVGGVFPDGRLCTTCYRTAIRTRGRCADCGFERLTPCRNEHDQPVCVDCGGSDKDFYCTRCEREGPLKAGECEHCRLRSQLERLTVGSVDLSALVEQFCAVDRADSVLIWLRQPHAQQMLKDLAAGNIALSHDGLDQIAQRHAADYLREVLVVAGLLEARDLGLARYDRWINEHLHEHVPHPDDRRVVDQFVRWKQRRRLETSAATAPLRSSQVNTATQVLRVVGQLCSHQRLNNSTIASLTQTDLDAWLTTGPTTRLRVRGFIAWANDARLFDHRVQMPKDRRPTSAVITQPQRIDATRRLLDPDTASLNIRCIGLLVCIWGQTISRTVTLHRTALTVDADGNWHIRLGADPSPIPTAVEAVFADLAASDQNRRLHNRDSHWLFPGMRSGTHLSSAWARQGLKPLIGDILAARNSALRQLVTDCPPPLVADMIGYTHPVTTRHAARAGSPWLTYAATRSR